MNEEPGTLSHATSQSSARRAFLRERLRLEPITPTLIEEVVQRIVQAVDPDQIILFGSAARGEIHEDSDLDLLVVKSGVTRHRRMQGQIDSLFWDKAIALDILVRSPEAIQRALAQGNSFLRYQVLEKGQVIYEKSSPAK